ncbi:MAG: hypothetical protein OXP66_11705 [Candidatus Tectomicrobia bacterium]|nr:hypothetical protein [Candidatus Tectomicrobia bacterium]
MHFEVLVEDASGKAALDILIPRIIGEQHTFRVIAYRGVGHIPRDLAGIGGIKARLLLHHLPQLLRGYGRTFAGYPAGYPAAVIVVCDLDDKCLKAFRQQLFTVLNSCNPQPTTRFCIAVEEGEAWLLGDIPAIKTAYPGARSDVLNSYWSDSICGTWELLADALFAGGSSGLRKNGWQAVGREKILWSENIAPRMDVAVNTSPSFQYFRIRLRELATSSEENP